MPFVDLWTDQRELEAELLAAVDRVVRRSAFVLGPEVDEFEERFATLCGTRHAVGVANGTDALLLALKAAGVSPGDEVVTAANTFIATVEAIVHAGARPVLVDVDPAGYTLDVAQLERQLTPRTRAIVPVHLYGCPADMAPLLELAKQRNLMIIEDAAQAHGAEYQGIRVGALGDAACFSFYPTKNLGAWGDAGAVTTNDERIAQRVRELRDHGSVQKYQHRRIGHNSRLDTLQAAVLLVKLRYLERWNEMRRAHAGLYRSLLGQLPGVALQAIPPGSTHVYHLFVIRLIRGDRDALRQHLEEAGVGTGVHYPVPVHLTAAFEWLGYFPGTFPMAEQCAHKVLSLPMYPSLSADRIHYVAQQIVEFLQTRI